MKPVMNLMTRGLLAALCRARLSAADVTLVADGQPGAAIVTAAEPHAVKAAAAIQKYIEKMSGARLPIIQEGEATRLPVAIFVGIPPPAEVGRENPRGLQSAIRPRCSRRKGS